MAKANTYNKIMGSLALIGLIIVVSASVYGQLLSSGADITFNGPENYGCGKHGKEGYATKCCGM